MANTTKGSQTSNFPDTLPNFTAQSETLDPATEDSTLAEGRDANRWSAEIEAIAVSIGVGGRGEVTVASALATIESLSYVYRGTSKKFLGEVGHSLQSGVMNYIYLDPATNTVGFSTSNWPTSAHIRLAIWDDAGGADTLTDERPHTLQHAGEYEVLSDVAGKTLVSGTATVLSGNTTVSVVFPVVFTLAPIITLGCARASDAQSREANHSNKTTTGFTIVVNTAAPASGVVVNWIAIGERSSGESGSGS